MNPSGYAGEATFSVFLGCNGRRSAQRPASAIGLNHSPSALQDQLEELSMARSLRILSVTQDKPSTLHVLLRSPARTAQQCRCREPIDSAHRPWLHATTPVIRRIWTSSRLASS